jgi:hypothetical protein
MPATTCAFVATSPPARSTRALDPSPHAKPRIRTTDGAPRATAVAADRGIRADDPAARADDRGERVDPLDRVHAPLGRQRLRQRETTRDSCASRRHVALAGR